jgi:hypothetical protein
MSKSSETAENKPDKLRTKQQQKLQAPSTMRSTMRTIRCMNTVDLEEWLEVRATMAEWSKAYENEGAAGSTDTEHHPVWAGRLASGV